MRKANLKEPSVMIDPSGFEQLAFWITALAPLLLLGGIIGAYLEFKIPGASLPGILRRSLLYAFFPRALSRWACGLGSRRAFRSRSGLAHDRNFVLRPFHHRLRRRRRVSDARLVALGHDRSLSRADISSNRPHAGSAVIKSLTRDRGGLDCHRGASPLFAKDQRLSSLRTHERESARTIVSPEHTANLSRRLAISTGMRGIAVTTLRPSGKARFENHIVDVVTEGEFHSAADTPISVVEADGMRVVVKAVA